MHQTSVNKRALPDSCKSEQKRPKKQCIEVSKKDSDSVTVRSAGNEAKSYKILSQVANLHGKFCDIQIMNAAEFMSTEGVIAWQKERVVANINFISNLKLILQPLYFPGLSNLNVILISDICYNVILHINDECVLLRHAIEAVNSGKKPICPIREPYEKLLIEGYRDPQLQEKWTHAQNNLKILKNIQKIYFHYVSYNSYKTLILAKIALNWNEEVLAIQLLKQIIHSLAEGSSKYKESMKWVYDCLEEYRKHCPFNEDTHKDLIEYYNFVEKASGMKPKLTKTTSCYSWNQLTGLESPHIEASNSSLQNSKSKLNISRTISCHNLNQYSEIEK